MNYVKNDESRPSNMAKSLNINVSYMATNEKRPNNMIERYGALKREAQCDSIQQYSDSNRRFRLPVQSRAITNTHTDGDRVYVAQSRSNLDTSSNSVFKSPADVNRMAFVAGPSRIQHNYDGCNTGRSVFNNPRCSGSDSMGISTNNRRSNGIAAGMSGMNVQETVASAPRLLPVSGDMKKRPVEQNLAAETSTANNFNFRVFGSSESEKMFIFTGTVEKVIKWNKIFKNHFCYFEVIAAVISIQEGSIKTQRIMLLRDRKGPILQVVYYVTTHMDIENFHVGQILRCIGKMSATNLLNAISIRSASQEEIDTLQRLSLICDHAVSHFLNA